MREPGFCKNPVPAPSGKNFHMAGGRVNRVPNVGQSRVQRGIPACRFLALVGPASCRSFPVPPRSGTFKVPEGLTNSSHGCKPVERIMSKTQDPDGVAHSLYSCSFNACLGRSGCARHGFIEPRQKMKYESRADLAPRS
jgi:hypothetical protein